MSALESTLSVVAIVVIVLALCVMVGALFDRSGR